MKDEILNKLIEFIIDNRWEYDFPLTRLTSLEGNLRITGDDADDFLIDFSKKFNVNVSNFKIGDYFGDEGTNMVSDIFHVFTKEKKKAKKILTIGHLEKAIIVGRLDEDVINS